MSRVAAVVPLYNHERFVAQAIESLLAQTRPLDRIIIIDDGSTDNSLVVARRFESPQLRAIAQANAGAHAALNRGIELAEDCDFIAILNSDDVFHPERIARCLALFGDGNTQVVSTNLRLIDEDGALLPQAFHRAQWLRAAWAPPRREPLVAWLGYANFLTTTSNTVARRSYLREHPVCNYRFVHDYRFFVTAALNAGLTVLDETLLDYRFHRANTMDTAPEVAVREVLKMNFDLAREIAARLEREPAVRQAWIVYHRAAWRNISSFRKDLFLTCVTRLIAGNETDSEIDALTVAAFPELNQFPNLEEIRKACDDTRTAEIFEDDVRKSGWLRLGARLGVKSAKTLLEKIEHREPQ